MHFGVHRLIELACFASDRSPHAEPWVIGVDAAEGTDLLHVITASADDFINRCFTSWPEARGWDARRQSLRLSPVFNGREHFVIAADRRDRAICIHGDSLGDTKICIDGDDLAMMQNQCGSGDGTAADEKRVEDTVWWDTNEHRAKTFQVLSFPTHAMKDMLSGHHADRPTEILFESRTRHSGMSTGTDIQPTA